MGRSSPPSSPLSRVAIFLGEPEVEDPAGAARLTMPPSRPCPPPETEQNYE